MCMIFIIIYVCIHTNLRLFFIGVITVFMLAVNYLLLLLLIILLPVLNLPLLLL